MGLYARFILPRVVDLVCSSRPTMRQRAKVVPLARGRVVELGFGSGLNLGFYDERQVEKIWAIEPAAEMADLAAQRLERISIPVEMVQAPAEDMPLETGCADTVLVTYTLCTLSDVARALLEVRRVLQPGGTLVFCEHGAAPDPEVHRWQNLLNPVWRRLGGGCNLNRPIPSLLEEAGFRPTSLSTMYLPGWRPASFNYWGTAVAT